MSEPKTPAVRVGREVHAQMIRAGVSQDDVAQGTGLSQSALSRRINGKPAFNVEELELIAAFLNISVATLIGECAA